MKPVGQKAGTAELLACLTLVAPSGLTPSDRQEWARVAGLTLAGIPTDLLRRGCEVARKICRFPSEIVPAIMGEIELAWNLRRDRLDRERALLAPPKPFERIAKPDPGYVSPADVKSLIADLRGNLSA